MNKNELIRRISEKKTISIKEATKCVNTVLGAIGDAMAENETLVIPEHEGFNPRTHEKMTIPQKERVTFKPYSRIKSFSIIH